MNNQFQRVKYLREKHYRLQNKIILRHLIEMDIQENQEKVPKLPLNFN